MHALAHTPAYSELMMPVTRLLSTKKKGYEITFLNKKQHPPPFAARSVAADEDLLC
jgi:hypothetical protein